MAVGENGIFTKAKEAKKAQVIAEAKESVENLAPEAIKTPYLFVDYIVR